MTYKLLSVSAHALDPDSEGFIPIQVRETRLMTETGKQVYHRVVHMPDHDCADEHPTVAAICAAIHTQEWKDKYQAKLDAEAAKAEAERLEQERVAAEQEAQRVADEEAARIAQEEAEAQRVADEQARIDAAVAAAIAAQQGA